MHISDAEVMAELMAKHQTIMGVLSSRQATLQVVRGFWMRGNVKGALTALLQSSGNVHSINLMLVCDHA